MPGLPVRCHAPRLVKNTESRLLIVGAIVRKLVHIIYGVFTGGRPFDPAMAAAV